ncbi:MAG: protein kinase [Acidobacteriota bacterium]
MPLAPGSKIGPYEIIELIGKGGMGEVYRAHDPRLRRDVAIKTSAQRFGERFEREARAVAALNHPNICQVYDVGPDYLVMELIEGPTLKERIKEGAIPLDEALGIANQIAEALTAAHEKLITHRDLKPGNVKIKEDGTVKVLDFGLAKIGNTPTTSASDESPTLSMSLTQAGVILGTAAYMSPEQARGKPVDSRSDIWAFGVVLYEMLTARRLFRGEDLTETLASIVKEEPNLSAIPRKVRRLLEACLQKDPKKRLQSIGDRHLLLTEPERQATGWLWPAAAAVIALAAAALAWTHFRETPPTVQSLRSQLIRHGDVGFTQFQLSPDGRYLAFIVRSGSNEGGSLFVRTLTTGQEREIPNTEESTYPFWSPDSTHIAFFSQKKLRQVALAGGPATDIAPAPTGRGGDWSTDGTIVFAPGVKGTLYKVSMSSDGTVSPATALNLPRPEEDPADSLRFPSFLPNPDQFFYGIEATNASKTGTYVGSLSGGPPVRISSALSSTRFVPSPGSETNGYLLFRRETTLMAQPFDATALKSTGEAFPLAEDVTASGNTGYADFSVSANGLLLFADGNATSQEREILWLDRTGKHGKAILKQKGVTSFALSPNGAHLLYSTAAQATKGDLWLRDVARGASQKFSDGTADSPYGGVWSPDGSSVVFSIYPEDRLFQQAKDSAKAVALPVQGTNSFATSWSRDGKLLLYSQTSGATKDDIWLLPMNGSGEQKPRVFKQTPAQEHQAVFSPDGQWIAYSSDASGRAEVYVEAFAPGGSSRPVSVDGGSVPRWRADGKALYFISNNKGVMEVDVKFSPEPAFGLPRELFRQTTLLGEAPGGYRFEPNSDGTQFLMRLPVGGALASPPLTIITNWQKAYGK